MTATELLEKEIKRLEICLRFAKSKKNSSESEIANIEEKLRLKREILERIK